MVWTEERDSVDVIEGVFTVDLGEMTPFPLNVAEHTDLYLASVNGGPNMEPRMRVSTTLRAQWAATCKSCQRRPEEDIHPATVSIRDTEVINAEGQWVGDPTGLIGPQEPPG